MLSLLALLSIPMLPAAQPGPAPSPPVRPEGEEAIVVTGQRPLTVREVQEHVVQMTPVTRGQLARFHRPVCPTVIGLPPAYATLIEARYREVAREADIDVLDTPCAPNVNLIVVPDGQLFMNLVRPHLHRHDLETSEIRNLMRDPGPVRMWSRAQTVNEHLQSYEEGGFIRVYSASIITQPMLRATNEVFMVIDDAAVMGKSLTQLADYFAMRTLAETHPPRQQTNANTILTLFEPGANTPDRMTSVDLGYLSGLYKSAPNRRVDEQRQRISAMISRQLSQPEPATSLPEQPVLVRRPDGS